MRWIESPDGVCRFCFVAKKKNGNAVYRNRCRRVLRPVFYAWAFSLNASCAPTEHSDKQPIWAMVFVNDTAKEMTAERLRSSAAKLLEKLENKLDAHR